MLNETWEQRIAREEREKYDLHTNLYREVASHLSGWHVRIDATKEYVEHRYSLVSDVVGQVIYLSVSQGKVHVHGSWPVALDGRHTSPRDIQQSAPSINCSLDKGGLKIARDIERRFVPEYTRLWALLAERVAAANAYSKQKLVNWQRIVDSGYVVNAITPDPTRSQSEDPRASIRIGCPAGSGFNYDLGYGDIRFTGENSCRIELRSVPTELAIQILKAIQESVEE